MQGDLMQKQEGKIGAVRRNVHGEACSLCGSRDYQLVLRGVKGGQGCELLARCRRCRCARDIDADPERVLWM